PEIQATFLSKLTYWWINKLIINGYKRPLTGSDVWQIQDSLSSKQVGPTFDSEWKQELRNKKFLYVLVTFKIEVRFFSDTIPEDIKIHSSREPLLALALVRSFGSQYLIASLLKLLATGIAFIYPQLLRYNIPFISSDLSRPAWVGYALAGLLFLTTIIRSFVINQMHQIALIVGIKIKTAIIWSLYRKTLKLSGTARKEFTVGQIVNLMAVDSERVAGFVDMINKAWAAPLTVVFAVYFLWDLLGPSVLASVLILVLTLFLNAFVAFKSRQFQTRGLKYVDERVKFMSEIVSGIKILKLYAWEKPFMKYVEDIRTKELQQFMYSRLLHAFVAFTMAIIPYVIALSAFATYVLAGNELNPEKVFVSLSLFGLMRIPLFSLPRVFAGIIEANVSLKRLSAFLSCSEISPVCQDIMKSDHQCVISARNASFKWDPQDKFNCLFSSITVDIREGSLTAIVGNVGSGKSSLLSALIGELYKMNGNINLQGSIAYVAQQVWIQNTTFQKNVLFGKEMDYTVYENVVKACALEEDVRSLPAEDYTEIGEKGVTLSGGQKQRLSLARAVYSNRDIYLLDDPLSSVDTRVSKHIFDEVIGQRGLLSNKAITHSIQHLSSVDRIIIMEDGKIIECGSYTELINRSDRFATFIQRFTDINKSQQDYPNWRLIVYYLRVLEDEDTVRRELDWKLESSSAKLRSRGLGRGRGHGLNLGERDSKADVKSSESVVQADKSEKSRRKERKIFNVITKEAAATGRVSSSVYLSYFKSLGLFSVVGIVGLIGIDQACQVGGKFWLAEWSTAGINSSQTDIRDRYLAVYGSFGAGRAIVRGLAIVLLVLASFRAARLLHGKMLLSVLRSPMSFFERTPQGRIINRFAKDVRSIDGQLSRTNYVLLTNLFSAFGMITTISISTPPFIAVIVVLCVLYGLIQRLFIPASRQLKRMQSISRSPIYSHFTECVQGAMVIRAYKVHDRFCTEGDLKTDRNVITRYSKAMCFRWLGVRLECIGSCITFFASVFAMAARDTIGPGIVGLSISTSLTITQTLNHIVVSSSELETEIVSVERLREYSTLPAEEDWETGECCPDANWPMNGSIQFNNFSTRYRPELDLALKNVNFTIASGERVGVIGRTGAGKSSLLLSLFRIIDSAGGSITIDGIDISKVGLQRLRSRLTVIPQDPVLFSGSIRMNLDPFNEYDDKTIWTALEHAYLKTFVQSLDNQLNHQITDSGGNISVGQKQLLCLARALLRKTKILLLDEATAAVDLETDSSIQETIRNQFTNCTVLTIAHRLQTVMDYSKIVGLESGKVMEVGSPSHLLSDPESLFYRMAKKAELV
ncbi:uncharacterized protein TRIADDRAFT_31533, partial [Trichoplax adhaerens]